MDCGPSEKSSPISTVPRLPLPPAKPYKGSLGAHCKQPPPAGAASPSQLERGSSSSHSIQSLPHLVPSATKAEKYSKLVEFDCRVLKRPTAYCRNALKNTEQIDAIKTQLQKDLRKLEGKQFDNELDRELAYLAVHRAALEAVIPLTGPYAPQLTKAKELYDHEVERALVKYNEMTDDPATTDSGDIERQKVLQHLKREVEKAEMKLRELEEENARLQKEHREEKEIHAVEMDRLQEPLPEPDLYEEEPLTAVVEGLQMEIAEQQETLEKEAEKRKTMVPIQVHRQHEQQLRDIQGEKRKLKAQNDLLSQQIESARLEIEATLEQANVSKDAIQQFWTALEEKLSSLSVTDKSSPVATQQDFD